MPNRIHRASLPPNLYWLLSVIFSNNQIWQIAPWYELRHLHYTNWQLKICIWWLNFSSWSPEGDQRIFLILSPALWNLKLLKFVFPGSHKNFFSGVISNNLIHLALEKCQRECNDWNYFGTRFLSAENKKLLNFLKDSILTHKKRFIVKNYQLPCIPQL